MDSVKRVERRGVSYLVYENESPTIVGYWDWDVSRDPTYEVLEQFLDKSHSYMDVGVHLGQTILYGSQLAKSVYAIEPDAEALRITKRNMELNDVSNVKLIPKALGNDSESIKLGSPAKYPELGNSRTAAFFADEANSFEVESISLHSLIESERINDLNFLKIDVEGMEDVVIGNATDLRIPLYMEIHTPWLTEKYDGYIKILHFLQRYENLTLFQGNQRERSSVTWEDLGVMYIENECPEGFFSILAY